MRPFSATLVVGLMACAALQGCDAPDTAEGVGGVTTGEARALNDAAAMLDERASRVRAAGAVTNDALPNESGEALRNAGAE